MEIEQVYKVVVFSAIILGVLFGFIAQSVRFCILGAISDLILYKNIFRTKMWLIALLTAIISTQTLILNNIISPFSSAFLGNDILWFSNLFGGLFFGFGMALASGCSSRAIIRVGEGNLKALVVLLVMSFSALVTLKGIIAPIRVNFFEQINFSISQYSDLISFSSIFVNYENTARKVLIIFTLFFLILILFFNIFNEKIFKQRINKSNLLSIVIGLLITCGWFVTGNVGFLSEHPDTLELAYIATNSNSIESFTFVGPIAYASELLTQWSDNSRKLTFGISLVIGTLLGSFLSAIFQKTFKIEGFSSTTDFYYHMSGGVLMGIGGVIAVGCSIGHGLSGLSFLSISSFITVISILVGAYFGLTYIQRQT